MSEQNVKKILSQKHIKSPAALVSYVLKHYFRVYPDEPLDIYVDKIRKLPYAERIKAVRSTQYPDVLIALAKDTDPAVREEVYKTEFWQLIGNNLEVIEFPRNEKIKLLKDGELHILLTFLLFEKDVEVIKEILNHPLFSLQIIVEYDKIMHERAFGLEDQKILNSISKIVKEKKERFHIISEIIDIKDNPRKKDYGKLLKNLLNVDPIVRKSALNALQTISINPLIEILTSHDEMEKVIGNVGDKIFDILVYLYKNFVPAKEFNLPGEGDKEIFHITTHLEEKWREFMLRMIKRFLTAAEDDLVDFQNLLTVVKAHVVDIPVINHEAHKILSLEDIFILIQDEHFPRASSKIIISILERHPDSDIKERIQAFYMDESERLRKKLKEMELSINAYFDIIFETLNYPQIYKIRQDLKLLNQSFRLFEQFFVSLRSELLESRKGFLKIYYLLIKDYQKKLENIYHDISEKRIEEIKELHEMLQLVYELKSSFIESEVDLKIPDYDNKRRERLVKQATLIWSSSISQYLGRLKEFDDLIRKKWLYYITERSSQQDKKMVMDEMQKVIQQMEQEHKTKEECTLPISCKVCQKRNCASVRFINQVEFFASELIEFIEEQK